MSATLIDAAWRAARPLPVRDGGQDKDARGKVLFVGGSGFVPGALLLCGEAALRAGAGKVQLATVDHAAIAVGVAFPEAATIGLPMDAEGEIDGAAAAAVAPRLAHCDTLVIGPGMIERPHTGSLVAAILQDMVASPVLLDAGALTAMQAQADVLRRRRQPALLTPHHGELASLMDVDKASILADPAAAACDAAEAFGAIVVLKAATTFIADRHGTLLRYDSPAPGLGTAGSGDVLAGIIGGLLARGVEPLAAAGWGVWLHGEAGRAASAAVGPIGFMARDLLPHLPRLQAAP